MTNEEFLNSSQNIELNSINNNNSNKSNFFVTDNNFTVIKDYFITLKACLVYVRNLINVSTLTTTIINSLSTTKPSININYTLPINGTESQTVNSSTYTILRKTLKIFEITRTTIGWSVEKLILQLKDVNGNIKFDKINSKDSKITIEFTDEPTTNFTLLWI